jgi:hypothetical protein
LQIKPEGYWGQPFSTNVYQDKALIDKYEFDNGIPLTFLIDKDGRLVYMHCGSLENTDELRRFLLKK